MDRSMKVMFGMMTVAICLMALSMTGNQSQQAYAGEYVGGGDRGTGLTIVSFRVIPITRTQIIPNGSQTAGGTTPTRLLMLFRMWSDGTVEVNAVGNETILNSNGTDLSDGDESFTGWVTVTDSVAGYACVGDTDGNRSVDVTDMLAVFNNWGECEQDPPINLPPDPDLM